MIVILLFQDLNNVLQFGKSMYFLGIYCTYSKEEFNVYEGGEKFKSEANDIKQHNLF